jgi:hypothetical protein
MNDVDKLTLELFTNKTQYKKYLSKLDPENYNEILEFREKCIEHKEDILKRIDDLLSNAEINNIHDPFYKFTSDLIIDIERKKQKDDDIYECEEEGKEVYDDYDDDDDVLFSPNNMIEDKEKPVAKHSFWGKERVIQQNSNDFITHYPTNTSVRRRYVGRRNSILPKDA